MCYIYRSYYKWHRHLRNQRGICEPSSLLCPETWYPCREGKP